MSIRITQHARERAEQRTGLTGAALEKLAEKAFADGLKHEDCRGKLRRYMDRAFLVHGKGNENRIWGRYVFIFEGPSLITVMHLPKEFVRAVENRLERKNDSPRSHPTPVDRDLTRGFALISAVETEALAERAKQQKQ